MSKPRKQKDHNPAPPVNGAMQCGRKHRWGVRDLNPERKSINCPVCGGYLSIAEALIQNDRQQR